MTEPGKLSVPKVRGVVKVQEDHCKGGVWRWRRSFYTSHHRGTIKVHCDEQIYLLKRKSCDGSCQDKQDSQCRVDEVEDLLPDCWSDADLWDELIELCREIGKKNNNEWQAEVVIWPRYEVDRGAEDWGEGFVGFSVMEHVEDETLPEQTQRIIDSLPNG